MTSHKPYLTLTLTEHATFWSVEIHDESQPSRGPILTFQRNKTNPLTFDLQEIITSAKLALTGD